MSPLRGRSIVSELLRKEWHWKVHERVSRTTALYASVYTPIAYNGIVLGIPSMMDAGGFFIRKEFIALFPCE